MSPHACVQLQRKRSSKDKKSKRSKRKKDKDKKKKKEKDKSKDKAKSLSGAGDFGKYGIIREVRPRCLPLPRMPFFTSLLCKLIVL